MSMLGKGPQTKPVAQESAYSAGQRAFKSMSLNDRRPVDAKSGQVKAMNGKC